MIGDAHVSRFTVQQRNTRNGLRFALLPDTAHPPGPARCPQEAVLAAAEEVVGSGVVERMVPTDVWFRPEDSRVSVCLRVTYCAPRRGPAATRFPLSG